MRKLLLLALIAVFGLSTPALALADHIQVANNTPDAWVWVTVINGRNLGAWCVNPGKVEGRTYGGLVDKVRVEVTKNAACAHPVMLDRTLNNYVGTGQPNQVRAVGAYFVNGRGGSYTFGHL